MHAMWVRLGLLHIHPYFSLNQQTFCTDTKFSDHHISFMMHFFSNSQNSSYVTSEKKKKKKKNSRVPPLPITHIPSVSDWWTDNEHFLILLAPTTIGNTLALHQI